MHYIRAVSYPAIQAHRTWYSIPPDRKHLLQFRFVAQPTFELTQEFLSDWFYLHVFTNECIDVLNVRAICYLFILRFSHIDSLSLIFSGMTSLSISKYVLWNIDGYSVRYNILCWWNTTVYPTYSPRPTAELYPKLAETLLNLHNLLIIAVCFPSYSSP